MKVKRHKYNLRGCNPVEKSRRREVNQLDFKKVFPFYSFDKDKIDLSLIRRFLYQNKIPYYHLYCEEMVEQQSKERDKLSNEEKISLLEDNDLIENRFEILDIRN